MGIFESLGLLFHLINIIISGGGWIVLLVIGLVLLWYLMVIYNQAKFLSGIKWVQLSIDVPKENEQSCLAVEQFFAQLHSIHTNHTFGERNFHGMLVLWVVFEIVSFGGQIKYIVTVPEKFRNLLESALYAQYPQAEIKEVEDYIKNLPPFDSQTSYYDVWGTDMILKKEDAYPIRTYRSFEHQAAQIIIDPLAGVLEAMSAIEPHELMAIQYYIQPIDDDWKESARKLVKKLKGEKEESAGAGVGAGGGIFEDFYKILSDAIHGFFDIFLAHGVPSEARVSAAVSEYEPPSKMMHLSPGEKDVITAIENNLGKIGYKTKIRLMYLAPKEKFRKDVRAGLVGSFRQFDDINLNGLKPDTKRTWTGKQYKLSEKLETPFLNRIINKRKRVLVRNFKKRSFGRGAKPFIFNIEELATVFHFPLITVKAPQLTKTEIRKGEAPINLPVQR